MRILIVPGLGGSEPEHWQSHWERSYPGATRVEQSDWNQPARVQWMHRLAQAVENAPGAILVGHSLGCVLIAHLAHHGPELPIAGALLVAPVDVDRADRAPPQVRGFAPTPLARMLFPAVVVASTNDPFSTIDRSRLLARIWGASFVDVGACGHINVAAGFGPWPQGESILRELARHANAPCADSLTRRTTA
jgi:predicted alpha/beta hydrolase family esterase